MATTKTVNYSDAQTVEMIEAYKELPTQATVEMLAEKMGKTVRSVVAKLSREGVYQKKERLTKSGEQVQKKDSMADAIGAILNMTEAECESLAKANKTALGKIFTALANSKPI